MDSSETHRVLIQDCESLKRTNEPTSMLHGIP